MAKRAKKLADVKVVHLKDVVHIDHDCIELLEELLEEAKAGKITNMFVGCEVPGGIRVSWAGRVTKMVGIAARAQHLVNLACDRYRRWS